MNYIAIIPARKGSKEILNKNIKILGGKPLIAWTIEQALNSKKISKVVVSTDSTKIAKISESYGAEVPFLRPEKFATDSATTEEVLLHAIEAMDVPNNNNAIVLLQPTSPIRLKKSIDTAIYKFEKERADSLVSVNLTKNFFWKKNKKLIPLYDIFKRPMRQNLKKNQIFYRENGSIYITKVSSLLKYKNRLGGKISMFEMSEKEGHEIDSMNDFQIVKNYITELKRKKIKASDIDAIIFDFDGVLTDNQVYLSSEGIESVKCNRSDGYSFSLLKKMGIKVFILSSEKNKVVEKRGQKLKIETISGSKDKKEDLKKICIKHKFDPKRLVYVGNDLNDLEVMKECGISFAVSDAVDEIKSLASIVLKSKGGGLVAREILTDYLE